MSQGARTLADVLLGQAEGPGADRLAFDDGRDRLTFAELAERAMERAVEIQRRGVRPGDSVAVVMSPGMTFVETFWGLQLAGAVPCAMNPTLPPPTLERRVGLTRPRLVVTDADAARLRASGRLTAADRVPTDVCLFQFTSGTSGEPRVAMITHRNVLSYLAATRGIDADDRFVGWVPPWHDLGLMRFVIGSVYSAAACHLVRPAIQTIPEWLKRIADVNGTVTAAPDFAYRIATRMVAAGTLDLSTLTFATIAAEPVRSSTIEAFEEHFNAHGALLPAYGLAEATVGVSRHVPGERHVVDERGNVSCGAPLPGVTVRTSSNPEAPSEILVRGDVVFAGYYEAPDETARCIRGGWLHTGDVGYRDDAGRLFILGRRSGMLKRGGGVVAPRELEEAAQQVRGVRLAAAVGVAIGSEPERITVVAEVDAEEQPSAERAAAEIAHTIQRALGFGPHRVKVVAPRTIPRTSNGKIRHARLRATLLEGAGS